MDPNVFFFFSRVKCISNTVYIQIQLDTQILLILGPGLVDIFCLLALICMLEFKKTYLIKEMDDGLNYQNQFAYLMDYVWY